MSDRTMTDPAGDVPELTVKHLKETLNGLLQRNEELTANVSAAEQAFTLTSRRLANVEAAINSRPDPIQGLQNQATNDPNRVRPSFMRPNVPNFDGRLTVNAARWIAQVEDSLNGAGVPRDRFTAQVVGSLQDEALSWYMQLRTDNGGQPPTWNQFTTKIMSHYNTELRHDELRTQLRAVQFTAKNVLSFISQFRSVAEQIPETFMTNQEKRALFLEKLPFSDQVYLRQIVSHTATVDTLCNKMREIDHTRHVSAGTFTRDNTEFTNGNCRRDAAYYSPKIGYSFGESAYNPFAGDTPMEVDLNTAQVARQHNKYRTCYRCDSTKHLLAQCPMRHHNKPRTHLLNMSNNQQLIEPATEDFHGDVQMQY